MKTWKLLVCLAIIVFGAAARASGASVAVAPSSISLNPNQSVQFSATTVGAPDIVIWSATGAGCIGVGCGTIASDGTYTAPSTIPSPATVTITATLLTDPTVVGTASVTVSSPSQVTVGVTPSNVQVGTGAQQQFKAQITGSTNTAVTWTISGIGCVANSCGTITSAGLYTGPTTVPTPSFLSVVAHSVAQPSASGSASVVIVQQVNVNVTPTAPQVSYGSTQQFTAVVSGTTNTKVNWTVTGASCSGSACGTISSAGLYTAPPNNASAVNGAVVNVTATSAADSTKSSTAKVTLILPITVAVTPTTVPLTVGSKQQFSAKVTGIANTAVTWRVQGAGCTGSACGTVTSSGLYTAPSTVPNPAKVQVIATSSGNTAFSGSATVTVQPAYNTRLNGRYAFLVKGFNAAGAYQAAGKFIADGKGHLQYGVEDVNTMTGVSPNLAFTGTYQINSDGRGTLTFTTTLGPETYAFALNQTASSAQMVRFDTSGTRASGVFKMQDPSAFDPTAFANGYAVELSGFDFAGGRIGALGLIYPSGLGTISGSSLDVNDAGNVFPTFGTFTGTYAIPASGRGALSLVIPGFDGGVFNFSMYVISLNEVFLISLDPVSENNPLFSGTGELQVGWPYTSSSFSGASVFSSTGFDGVTPQTSVGWMKFDGLSSVTQIADSNFGGNISVTVPSNGAFSIELNGRGDMEIVNSQTGIVSIVTFYAIAPNRAFLLDASTAAASTGEMKPQFVVLPIDNADLQGTFAFGSAEPPHPTTLLLSGEATFDGSSGASGYGRVAGAEDESMSSGLVPNASLVGQYKMSAVSNNGRGVILGSSPVAGTYALWLISDSEAVGLQIDNSATEPSVLFFNQ